ncbi:forkhead box protein c2 [Moniliophthora roreri MCA 2997]|uniref:Forkhead box protein c2 n=1 Tax=Moniliophthora roreri (strain MCA 2997) TaxID=1381753 RepID=V2YLW4_MONRO|nr:forkhead box protein c2 [Moniliophthora roreri MCA 2997]
MCAAIRTLLNPVQARMADKSLAEHSQLSHADTEVPSSPDDESEDSTVEVPHDDEEGNGEDEIPGEDDAIPEDSPTDSPTNATTIPQYVPQHRDHKPHPNCPDTLACLPDTDGRPQHTLPVILRCAILGSPRKRLTIREIYAAMEGKYAYYRTAGSTWKQSVRHHLSLNRLFERQPRPVTDPGFGSYWTVNLAAPPGTKRPRKRGRPNKNKDTATKEVDKRRGRPRKDSEPPPTKWKPSPEGEFMDELQSNCGGDIHMHGRSEDELLESEEEIMHPFERRSSLIGLTPYPSGAAASRALDESAYATIEKLQTEVAELRRQSSDAVSLSIRLSDQLAQAHAEASRAKSSLRSIESLLEEESGKRMDAEKQVAEEIKLRHEAEEKLREAEARISSMEQHWEPKEHES